MFAIPGKSVRGSLGLILGAAIGLVLAAAPFSAQAGESFAVVGDAGNFDAGAKSVRDSVVRAGLKRLVIPGDNLYNLTSTYDAEWRPWASKGLTFDVVAIGNHNLGYANEVAYFKMPGEYYSKTFDGSIRFIVLNSDNPTTGGKQAAWLEEQLASATEPQIFIVYHHPSLTVSDRHVWTERRAFQAAVRPLLFKYRSKITAVLNGHDHIASFIEFGDLPVVVSGAVQEIRHNPVVDNTQEGIAVKMRWLFDETPHWARLDVESGGTVFRYIRAEDDRVDCTVKLFTGKKAEIGSDCR